MEHPFHDSRRTLNVLKRKLDCCNNMVTLLSASEADIACMQQRCEEDITNEAVRDAALRATSLGTMHRIVDETMPSVWDVLTTGTDVTAHVASLKTIRDKLQSEHDTLGATERCDTPSTYSDYSDSDTVSGKTDEESDEEESDEEDSDEEESDETDRIEEL